MLRKTITPPEALRRVERGASESSIGHPDAGVNWTHRTAFGVDEPADLDTEGGEHDATIARPLGNPSSQSLRTGANHRAPADGRRLTADGLQHPIGVHLQLRPHARPPEGVEEHTTCQLHRGHQVRIARDDDDGGDQAFERQGRDIESDAHIHALLLDLGDDVLRHDGCLAPAEEFRDGGATDLPAMKVASSGCTAVRHRGSAV